TEANARYSPGPFAWRQSTMRQIIGALALFLLVLPFAPAASAQQVTATCTYTGSGGTWTCELGPPGNVGAALAPSYAPAPSYGSYGLGGYDGYGFGGWPGFGASPFGFGAGLSPFMFSGGLSPGFGFSPGLDYSALLGAYYAGAFAQRQVACLRLART